MHTVELILTNESGLHARPASLFVQEAGKYQSDIVIIKEGKEYNGKSIIGILSMGAVKEDRITLLIDGEDEKEAGEGLSRLIEAKFYE